MAKLPKVPRTHDGLWTLVRALKTFTADNLVQHTKMGRNQVYFFLEPLAAGGYIEKIAMTGQDKLYRLTRDTGAQRPRLSRAGKPLPPTGADRLWSAMKALKGFDTRDLSLTAMTSADYTRSYCAMLEKAGYLFPFVERPGGKHTAFRFNRAKDTGPYAPTVIGGQRVFDRNLGRVVWPESEAA